MSTGKRLAKRSILQTRVCARGQNGIWYQGRIHSVKTPSSTWENNNCINLTPFTRYSVLFDGDQDLSGVINMMPAIMFDRKIVREFSDKDLHGPGFQSINGIHLEPEQKIYVTYNGRESAGRVIKHDYENDEVTIRITPIGTESPLEVKKRLDEVRLLESRRSARLADQPRDTDFARLADMAGDRRRASHNIDVPASVASLATQQQGSRKRRPSNSNEDFIYDDPMNECNAALVLMSLSNSPHSHQWNLISSSPGSSSASWSSRSGSPPLSDASGASSSGNGGGVNCYISNTGSRLRTTSLTTSDESGIAVDYIDETIKRNRFDTSVALASPHNIPYHAYYGRPIRQADTPNSDDYTVVPKRKRNKRKEQPSQDNTTISPKTKSRTVYYKCTYPRCGFQDRWLPTVKRHIRAQHISKKKPTARRRSAEGEDIELDEDENTSTESTNSYQLPEEDFFYEEFDEDEIEGTARADKENKPQPSPTLSHRDMARPPHEDPEYQRQIVGTYRQEGLLSISSSHQSPTATNVQSVRPPIPIQISTGAGGTVNIPTSPLTHHNYGTWNQSSQMSPQKQIRLSPRPSTSCAPYPTHYSSSIAAAQHNINMAMGSHPRALPFTITTGSSYHSNSPLNLSHSAPNPSTSNGQRTNSSPKSKTRGGENRKCRKVYGMDNKESWCTQCKWKKACTRFTNSNSSNHHTP